VPTASTDLASKTATASAEPEEDPASSEGTLTNESSPGGPPSAQQTPCEQASSVDEDSQVSGLFAGMNASFKERKREKMHFIRALSMQATPPNLPRPPLGRRPRYGTVDRRRRLLGLGSRSLDLCESRL